MRSGGSSRRFSRGCARARGAALAAALAACAAALGGCSSWDYAMGARYGTSAAAPAAAPAAGGAATTGTTVIAGGAGLHVSVSLGSTAANVMAAATGVAIYAAMLEESGELRLRRGPPMLEGRAVNEQDCTKPIADTQANLKCK